MLSSIFQRYSIYILATLVVQVEQLVRCVCVCECMQTIKINYVIASN